MSKNKPQDSKASVLPMPRATAVWMIMYTSLTIKQIATFCGIHPIEVKSMMDEPRDVSVLPQNPIGQYVSAEEIEKGQKDGDTGCLLS